MVLSQYRLFYQQKHVYMKQMADILSFYLSLISNMRDKRNMRDNYERKLRDEGNLFAAFFAEPSERTCR